MISISGSNFGEPGSTICLTVSGIGASFSATAIKRKGKAVKLTVSINPKTRTATVCFTVPASGESVTIVVADNSGAEEVTHTVFGR